MFKLIPNNFPYAISKEGEVINTQTKKLLKSHIVKKGYLRTTFKNKKKYLIHRLVALTYIPNPNNLPQINHIDGDKSNNNVSNLEWVSDEQNRNHAIQNGLWNNISYKVRENCETHKLNTSAKLKKEDVLNILNLINKEVPIKKIAELYNVHKDSIHNIRIGKTWNWLTGVI